MKWVLLFIIFLPNGDKEVEQMKFETRALCETAITRFNEYTEGIENAQVKKYGLQAPEKIKPIMCVQVGD